VGTLVDVRQGRDTFTGRVSEVTPLSRNGVISFTVSLDDDSDKRLKSGLKCDVYVKSSIKSDVLRVGNGAYYKGKGKQEVFVREGDKLYRREVLLGESNYDYVEVLEGLREGEVIVTNSQESMPDRNTLNIER
jgi:HlyD family secretion protein